MTLTTASPTTLSSGNYYVAGRTYDFSVQVVDPTLTAWGNVTSVVLTIPNGGGASDITATIGPLTGASPINATTQGVGATITVDISGTYNNFTATFHVPVTWGTTANSICASRTVRADATTTGGSATRTQTYNYGVCAAMRVLGFAQNGNASDGYVNSRSSTAFNVSGTLVYDISGATAADAIGTAITATLYVDATYTNLSAAVNNPSFSVTISSLTVPVQTAMHGNHAWYIHLDSGTYGTETSANSLPITCDEVAIQSIELINVAGEVVSASPNHIFFTSTNAAGTRLRVTANMRYTTGPMLGDTTIGIYDNSGTPIGYNVTIINGDTVGEIVLSPYPTIPAGTTEQRTYTATTVTGGYTDNDQNASNLIYQPGDAAYAGSSSTRGIWENADPPGGTLSTSGVTTSTAETITIHSTQFTVPSAPNYIDEDFATYKIYYKRSVDTVWNIIDNTTVYTEPGPPVIPYSYAFLGNITAGNLDVTIWGLQPLMDYQFRVSAVDIFGNEMPLGNMYTGNYATQPSSTVLTMTDGITSYTFDPSNNPFDQNPVTYYPLRKTGIRLDLNLVTAGTTPSAVDIILADNGTDAQFGSGTNDDITTTTTYTISCVRTAPNKWTGYIPSGQALMNVGTTIRFILKVSYGSSYVYYDSLNEAAPGNYIAREFRFYVANEPDFTPWPTRMLNNVITDDNPRTYPSYYLTDDAYVTITAYDIKGRPVAILLDKAWRPKGQNIKEGGWAGTNKFNKKLGVGLYYIRIYAVSATTGRVIIDKYSKVVVAR